MQRKKIDVDVVLDVLKETLEANPDSVFVSSLLHQYQERGGLSRKQLEGLYHKAVKVKSIPFARLATLEAIIIKKPERFKSEIQPNKPLYEKDEEVGKKITAILEKYPQHKAVLFMQTKYENNETLSTTEVADLERFHKFLK
jgi:hypothetical protein